MFRISFRPQKSRAKAGLDIYETIRYALAGSHLAPAMLLEEGRYNSGNPVGMACL
jgi:hypothetical protein